MLVFWLFFRVKVLLLLLFTLFVQLLSIGNSVIVLSGVNDPLHQWPHVGQPPRPSLPVAFRSPRNGDVDGGGDWLLLHPHTIIIDLLFHIGCDAFAAEGGEVPVQRFDGDSDGRIPFPAFVSVPCCMRRQRHVHHAITDLHAVGEVDDDRPPGLCK